MLGSMRKLIPGWLLQLLMGWKGFFFSTEKSVKRGGEREQTLFYCVFLCFIHLENADRLLSH